MPSKRVTQEQVRDAGKVGPLGDPPASKISPNNALLQACGFATNIHSLDRALASGGDVNCRSTDHGWTPLMKVVSSWHTTQCIPFLEKLFERKADPNIENDRGFTAVDVVNEQVQTWEALRLREMDEQNRRRDQMEGKGPTGFGYGSAEEWRNRLVWNQPMVEELDVFKMIAQLYKVKELLERKGGLPGVDPFDFAYLTDEEYITKRDAVIERNAILEAKRLKSLE